MNYVQGFVTPVPTANKEKYRKQASDAVPLFKQFGVTRMVEGWGDDVPKGKVTDFQGAVQAKDDETVVFSWMEYPDKATYEAANKKMMDDPRMKEMVANMPFDGKRMIFGGFESIVDEAGRGSRVMPTVTWCRCPRATRRPIARWPPRRPTCSRNMARPAWSKPGATTCPTARSPTSGAP